MVLGSSSCSSMTLLELSYMGVSVSGGINARRLEAQRTLNLPSKATRKYSELFASTILCAFSSSPLMQMVTSE